MNRLLAAAWVGMFSIASLNMHAQMRGGMGGGGRASGGMSAPRGSMGSVGGPRGGAGFGPRVVAPAQVGSPMRGGAPVRVISPGRTGAPVGVNRFVGAPVGVNRTVGVTRVSPSGGFFVNNRFPGHFHNGGFHHGHSHVFFRGCFGFPCNNPFLFNSAFGFGFGTGFGWGWGVPYAPYYYPDSSYYPYEPNYAAAPAQTSAD